LKDEVLQIAQNVTGGVPPYGFALAATGPGATLDPTGGFAATEVGNSSVKVTDAAGTEVSTAITAYDVLRVSVDRAVVSVGSKARFTAVGGVIPYAFSVTSGPGAVDAEYAFSSSQAGSSVVCVTDKLGNQDCQTVQTVSRITLTPNRPEIAILNTVTIDTAGGVLPLTFQETTDVASGGPLFDTPTCTGSTTCTFTGLKKGTGRIEVTDAEGNKNVASIVINSPLAINPTTVQIPPSTGYSFVATGGVKPYTYSSTAGSMSSTSAGTFNSPATEQTVTVTVKDKLNNTATATVEVTGSANFAGLTTVARVDPTTIDVFWVKETAASFVAYDLYYWKASDTPADGSFPPDTVTTKITITDINVNMKRVTGLSPETDYVFEIFVSYSGGGGSGSYVPRRLALNTGTISVIHKGWLKAKVLGPRKPAAVAADMSIVPASVSLSWAGMQAEQGIAVSGYNVYRGPTLGALTKINTTPVAHSATVSFSDPSTSLVPSQSFFYMAKPIINGVEVTPGNTENPTSIKVVIPPDNMALVHRWIANRELCANAGLTSDAGADYSCQLSSPAGGLARMDVATASQVGYFIDQFEAGCNFSKAKCNFGGGLVDCIGNVAPQGVVAASKNSVYYDRSSGTCYLYTDPIWVEAAGASTDELRYYIESNAPGLPPLVYMPQDKAAQACEALGRVLPTRRQQIQAAAWDGLAPSAITAVEAGGASTTNCNSDLGHGLGQGYALTLPPANPDTLPFIVDTVTSTVLGSPFRSGSTQTSGCLSRYGVQDLAGNVWEWGSDQVFCSKSSGCFGVETTIHGAMSDFKGINPIPNNNGGGTTNSWALTASSKLYAPLMLPVAASATFATVLPDANLLGNSFFRLNGGVNFVTRGILTGGAWDTFTGTGGSGGAAGRFSLDLSVGAASTDFATVGFRCVQATP
jgi:hypothetical protein